MTRYYAQAEALERYLGDPFDPEAACAFQQGMKFDEQELYPEPIGALLSAWCLHHYYVPVELGGKLTSFEELLGLVRLVARRDFTLALAHGLNTYLAAVNVWLSGSKAQQQDLASIILAGDRVTAAYHEEAHGSDLLSDEVEATPTPDGYCLSGTKWVVSALARSQAIIVFARTAASGGPRGFSLFLVRKSALPPASYSYLPRFKTHGYRGADIGGIRFDKSPVPAAALIGAPGFGLESTMRAFQVTRTLAAALSLGCGDSALRVTLQFVLERQLYGASLLRLAHVDSQLVDAFLDLLVCDCVATAGARALHVAPEQASVWSAVVKYLVPATIQKTIGDLSVVLGARHYLREEHCAGVFQKILRDHAVTSVGHVPAYLNLSTIIQNMLPILRQRTSVDAERGSRLQAVFALEQPLPRFDGSRLTLFNRGRDDVLLGVNASLDLITLPDVVRGVDPSTLARIVALSRILFEERETLAGVALDLSHLGGAEFARSPESFDLAKRYCTLFGAAACLHMWAHSRAFLGPFFASGGWLEMCLERLLCQLRPVPSTIPRRHRADISTELMRRFTNKELFSIVPVALAGSRRSPDDALPTDASPSPSL